MTRDEHLGLPPLGNGQRTSGLLTLGLLLGLALPGCARTPSGGPRLTIATPWSRAERTEIERELRRWLAEARDGPGRTVSIDWIIAGPGEDLAQVVEASRDRLDVVLGGPAAFHERLVRTARRSGRGVPEWRVAARSAIGLVRRSGRGDEPGFGLTFDDPRRDPVALAWAKGRLGAGKWSEGYAGLVRDAGHAGRIGRQAGSALAAVERGEAASAPAVLPRGGERRRVGLDPAAGAPEWVEGVALLPGGRHEAEARAFVRFLIDRGQAEPRPPGPAGNPDADDLLADLLGATLVDAQDELRSGWSALERAGRPGRAEGWMTEPPPWPPASIRKLLDREGAGELLETLTGQVAPDADVRAWLARNWLAPSRPVDGGLLEELAAAVDGRLVREPRFRAWLRAEWTAWARQRYRRVARVAEGRWP